MPSSDAEYDSAKDGASGFPGIGFTTASCSAYITMNGGMIPGVSAGSDPVGGSEICRPQVSWPCGPAARPTPGAAAAANPAAVKASASRRVTPILFDTDLRFPWRLPDQPISCSVRPDDRALQAS